MTFARNRDITLKIQDHKTGKESRIRIDVTMQLKKLLDIYCNMKSLDRNTLVFSRNGCPLNACMTLDQLQLVDGDKIDALLQQRAPYKDKAVMQQNSMHQNTRSSSVEPSAQHEMRRDKVFPVRLQLQESHIDMSLSHQQEQGKHLETNMDHFVSVQQQQQSQIDALLRHQEEQFERVQQQHQSQINTVLCQQEEQYNQLETKMDRLDFIQQQQQKQMDNLLRQQQDYGNQLAAIKSLVMSLKARPHQAMGDNDEDAMNEEKHVHVDGADVGSDDDGLFVLV